MIHMIPVGMTERYGFIVVFAPHLKRRIIGIVSENMGIMVPKAIMYVLFWLSDS